MCGPRPPSRAHIGLRPGVRSRSVSVPGWRQLARPGLEPGSRVLHHAGQGAPALRAGPRPWGSHRRCLMSWGLMPVASASPGHPVGASGETFPGDALRQSFPHPLPGPTQPSRASCPAQATGAGSVGDRVRLPRQQTWCESCCVALGNLLNLSVPPPSLWGPKC